MVCTKYWLARHSSKIDDVRQVFILAEKLVARIPPPWERSRRGRPPKFSARMHAAICLTSICLDLTYREVEGLAPAFIGNSIDHSTVGWAFKRLSNAYLDLLLLLLSKELQGMLRYELYMVDSTGISTPRLVEKKRGLKRALVHETKKLHAFVGYSSEESSLAILAASVTDSSAHDSTQFEPLLLLSKVRGNGEPLLADPAYDSGLNLELAQKLGFRPMIKLRAFELHGLLRREAAKEFKEGEEIYRMRSVAEAIFAGIANRYGSRTRCKLPCTQLASVMLMAISHNLRTLMRVRAMKGEILIFILIYSTNPCRGTL